MFYKLSFFKSASSKARNELECSEAKVSWILQDFRPKPIDTKEANLPHWSPLWKSGNKAFISCLVFAFHGQENIGEVAYQFRNYNAVTYTGWQHKVDAHQFYLVFFLGEVLTPTLWKKLHKSFREKHNIDFNELILDPEKRYPLPCSRLDHPRAAFSTQGEHLKSDEYIGGMNE